MHEVANFPHQRLVPVDDLARQFVILVEPGAGHLLLERLELALAFGDPGLERPDPVAKRVDGPLLATRLGIGALSGIAIDRPGPFGWPR
jgi:hypothetical protein